MGASRRLTWSLGMGGLVLVLGAAAVAETAGSGLPAAVQKLLDCRAVTPDAARLACYDTAVADFGRLIGTGEIVVVDHERVAKVKRQAFGFSLPSLNLFERPNAKPAELDHIAAVAASAYQNKDGKWVVELEDGAVWRQTDSDHLPLGAHKGSKVEIRKAALGSFFMNIDGQRALRAERVK
jgi:hypothetical protein